MKAKNPNKSLLKAITILKSFQPKAPEQGVSDISRKTRIPITTVHRILSTLTEGGLLNQNAKTGKYEIGPELYILGSLYLETTDVLKAAGPVVRVINDLTKETVNISIREQGNITIIMREESKHVFRYSHHIGTSLPAYASAMGQALLSELPEEEIDRLYPDDYLHPITPKTITSKAVLKSKLKEIRETGISLNREGSYQGITSIATVIREATGTAVAAMSISVPVFRLTEPRIERLAKLATMGASLISYRLGYQNAGIIVRDITAIQTFWEHEALAWEPEAESLDAIT